MNRKKKEKTEKPEDCCGGKKQLTNDRKRDTYFGHGRYRFLGTHNVGDLFPAHSPHHPHPPFPPSRHFLIMLNPALFTPFARTRASLAATPSLCQPRPAHPFHSQSHTLISASVIPFISLSLPFRIYSTYLTCFSFSRFLFAFLLGPSSNFTSDVVHV